MKRDQEAVAIIERRPGRLDSHKVFHLIAETLAPELFGVLANRARVELSGIPLLIPGERFNRKIVDKQSGFVLAHGFDGTSAAERYDRPAACLGFKRNDAEILLAGQEYDG